MSLSPLRVALSSLLCGPRYRLVGSWLSARRLDTQVIDLSHKRTHIKIFAVINRQLQLGELCLNESVAQDGNTLSLNVKLGFK